MKNGQSIKESQSLRRSLVYSLVLFSLLAFAASPSWSAGYPDRPINMIVPFAPGGALDLGSRVVADKIGEVLGQPLVGVYKPGGGGALGAALVAKAKPDGYTVLAASPSFLTIPTIVKKLDYKYDELTPIGMYGKIPLWLVVKADARWKTLKDFVDEEKRAPGTLKIGYLGKFSSTEFGIILLNKYAGTKFTQVAFPSSGVGLTSVLGGHIDAMFATGAGGLLESGQVRILGVAEDQRLDGLPNALTFKESGYPIVVMTWNSLFFPRDTPKEMIQRLSSAQEVALKRYSKEIKEGLRRVEVWADFRSGEETMDQFKKDYNFFYKLCDELGVVAK